MMRPSKGQPSNPVVNDRQWIRRVKQEEINMIDSFTGKGRNQIDQARTVQNKNHFYPQTGKMQQNSGAAAQAGRRQQEDAQSLARDSDGLDSVSQYSVMTPKSKGDGYSRNGDSVSYQSAVSGYTTVSTKRKLQDLERQLQEEREMRIQMEKRMAALQGNR